MIFRGDFRTLLWVCLAALALGGFGVRDARALDSVGLRLAVDEVRVALDEMADALNAAPPEVQTTISADLHLMSQAITRALGRLEDDGVPIVDPTLVYDLNLLTDIADAATSELRAASTENAQVDERAARIDALADAAAARLVEVNLVIDGWTERSRNAVVELTEVDGALVVRSTDRLIYNGVRYTSIGLLLVGLLVVGLQLLRMSEDRVDSLALLRETPVLSSLAIVVLALFFAGCFMFSLRPGTLAALSAEVREQPQEHPCERLAEQRDRLIAAQQVAHNGLVEATKRRMVPAARDCLGLPSDTATAEAIELLAAKTALAQSEPLWSEPEGVAIAEAEPQEPASEADDDITMPAMPAPAAEPSEPEPPALDALAEIAAQLREAETALSERLDDVMAAELETAEDDEPAPDPAPAAGPAPAPAAGAQAEELAPLFDLEAAAEDDAPDGVTADVVEAAAPRPEVEPVAQEEPEAELYVTTTALNYRDGPSLDARRLGTFVPGARLAVISQDDGWSEVRLGDGREVYVASEFLEQVP